MRSVPTNAGIIWITIATVMALLVSANSFFLRGIITKIDKIESLENRLTIIETKIQVLVDRALVDRSLMDSRPARSDKN